MIPFFKEFCNKIMLWATKGHIFIILLLILSSSSAFFLGRLSSIFDQRPVFEIKDVNDNFVFNNGNTTEKAINTSTSTIVASRKGKKYYFIWCKSVSNIKDSNRRYFKTEEEAKAAGLSLANNCK